MEIAIEDYIKLDSLLKYASLVQSGGEAKFVISEGMVEVNGEVELRRGRKIRKNDRVKFLDNELVII